MSDDHKAALARGRAEGRAVRRYLETLRSPGPARGPKRTAESISQRLAAIEQQLQTADAMTELRLVQQRRDLTSDLARVTDQVDDGASEAEFMAVAKAYSERQGISYAAWREVGVPAAVLNRAGITRTS